RGCVANRSPSTGTRSASRMRCRRCSPRATARATSTSRGSSASVPRRWATRYSRPCEGPIHRTRGRQMNKVGLVGWRGKVGSVLMQRMEEEGDFARIEPVYFSTSNAGGKAPDFGGKAGGMLHDASDIDALAACDIVVSCQGGDYTKQVFETLRTSGWNGHWIDAASTLRMADDAVIVLDPVNRDVIDAALENGNRNWIGGNCTVSLMLIGLGGL